LAIGKTVIEEQIRRAKMLSETIAWLKTFDNATKNEILDFIKIDQLTQKGVDKDGNVIGYYSQVTEFISRGRKKFNTHYTLFDTGDFYRSMYVMVFQQEIVIEGDTRKMEDKEWFSNRIIGLTDENFRKLKEIVKASYIDYARKTIFRH
jgi:hypothetical protein